MKGIPFDIRSAFWRLPFSLQSFLYPRITPDGSRRLERLKSSVDENGYSLAPFIRHRCIFVHVPKCAGISVAQSLFGNKGGGHTKISKYRLAFGPVDFREYFKFTFVRNPWDRVVSAFQFLKKGGMDPLDKAWAEKNLSGFGTFDEFVKRWLNERSVNTEIHFEEQHRFICVPGGMKPAVDFLGRIENIETDYAFICSKLKIENKLQKLNKTTEKRVRYQEQYTRESAEIVGRVYRKDIELLGYRFD